MDRMRSMNEVAAAMSMSEPPMEVRFVRADGLSPYAQYGQ